MNPTQISFVIPDKNLKDKASDKAKKQGLTMKAVLLSLLEDYVNNDYKIKLIRQEQGDDIMTEDNYKNWQKAKEDLKNNRNIVSWEELKKKHLPKK